MLGDGDVAGLGGAALTTATTGPVLAEVAVVALWSSEVSRTSEGEVIRWSVELTPVAPAPIVTDCVRVGRDRADALGDAAGRRRDASLALANEARVARCRQSSSASITVETVGSLTERALRALANMVAVGWDPAFAPRRLAGARFDTERPLLVVVGVALWPENISDIILWADRAWERTVGALSACTNAVRVRGDAATAL